MEEDEYVTLEYVMLEQEARVLKILLSEGLVERQILVCKELHNNIPSLFGTWVSDKEGFFCPNWNSPVDNMEGSCYAENIIREGRIHLPDRQENASARSEPFHLIKPIKPLFIGGP